MEHSGGRDPVGWQPTRCSIRDLGRQRGGSVQGHALQPHVAALGTESPTLAMSGLPWGMVYIGLAHWREAPPSQPMPRPREP